MARALSGRITIKGCLEALDALHVGSGEEDTRTDMAVAVNGQGKYYVPGTGLAGALRHWCVRRFADELVNQTWGFQPDRESSGNAGAAATDGHASYALVEDGTITIAGDGVSEIRDHVGIDRQWGAAAQHIKFDRAVVPRGATCDFEMSLDLSADTLAAARAQAMLGHLIRALQAGDVRLGAAKTRGLGRVKLTSLDVQKQSWDRQGLIDRLLRNLPALTDQQLIHADPKTVPRSIPRLMIEINWQPVDPVMVKSGIDGLQIDTLPLLGCVGDQQAPLIPASSIKGTIRAQVERILRTVLGRDPSAVWARAGSGRKRFLRQLDEDLPLVRELFGSRHRKTARSNDHLGQGGLAWADCFAKPAAPSDDWNRLYYEPVPVGADETEDQALQRAFASSLDAVGNRQWQRVFHNAVDRWTGGAADTALFQVLEPRGEDWGPLVCEIDFNQLATDADGNDRPAADQLRVACWVLMLLALRDLAQRRIPLGFGGNRGFGEIKVKQIVINPLEGNPLGIDHRVELADGELAGFGTDLLTQWQTCWKSFI